MDNQSYYTEEDFSIIQNYFFNSTFYKRILFKDEYDTITSIAHTLGISRAKVQHYMQFIPCEKDECIDNRFYTKSYVDKIKKLYAQYPEIKQNRVYVKGLNICFDSRPEAILYIYLKDHNIPVKFHTITLSYNDAKGKKRRYEVDFEINGTLVEIKGKNQFDEKGNPVYLGKTWKEKFECMKLNGVVIIKSSQFEPKGCLKYMTDYFNKHYSFEKDLPVEITGQENEILKDDRYAMRLKMNLKKQGRLFCCIETSEKHFGFEWNKIFNNKHTARTLGLIIKTNKYYKGYHWRIGTEKERQEYIESIIQTKFNNSSIIREYLQY